MWISSMQDSYYEYFKPQISANMPEKSGTRWNETLLANSLVSEMLFVKADI